MMGTNLHDKTSKHPTAQLFLGTVVAIDNKLPASLTLFYAGGRKVLLVAGDDGLGVYEEGLRAN